MDTDDLEMSSAAEQHRDRPRTAAVRLLATRIIAGQPDYQADDVLHLDALMKEIEGSRALAREVLQALQHKGMVTLKARVGATVRPAREWNVFDPDVIQWRLDVAPRFPMRSLTELRRAVEPEAASLAAQRASSDVCRDLVNLAVRLKSLADDVRFGREDGDGEACRMAFRDVDAELHRTILAGSGNELFRALADPIEATLNFRISTQWEGAKRERKWARRLTGEEQPTGIPSKMKTFPYRPAPLAMWLHYGVVHAITQGQPQAAETFARALITESQGQLNDPFLQHSLALALRILDLSAFDEDDQAPFEESIMTAAGMPTPAGGEKA